MGSIRIWGWGHQIGELASQIHASGICVLRGSYILPVKAKYGWRAFIYLWLVIAQYCQQTPKPSPAPYNWGSLTLWNTPLKLEQAHAYFVLKFKITSSGSSLSLVCVTQGILHAGNGGLQLLWPAGDGQKRAPAVARNDQVHGHKATPAWRPSVQARVLTTQS